MKNSKNLEHEALVKIYEQKLITDSDGKWSNYGIWMIDQGKLNQRMKYLQGDLNKWTVVDWNGMQGHFGLYQGLRVNWKSITILNAEKKMSEWCRKLWNTLVFENKHKVTINFINRKPSTYKTPGDFNLFLSLFHTQNDVHEVWNKLATDQVLITNCNITLKGACVIDKMEIERYVGFSPEDSKKFKLYFYRKGPYKYQHNTSRLGFKNFKYQLEDPISFEKEKMKKEWKDRTRK